MKVSLLGKERLSGTSRKTGKAFDSVLAHVSYSGSGVIGSKVETVWLDPVSSPLESLLVGDSYDLDRDSRGYVVAFTHVGPAASK